MQFFSTEQTRRTMPLASCSHKLNLTFNIAKINMLLSIVLKAVFYLTANRITCCLFTKSRSVVPFREEKFEFACLHNVSFVARVRQKIYVTCCMHDGTEGATSSLMGNSFIQTNTLQNACKTRLDPR